jgi:hypothetical protein
VSGGVKRRKKVGGYPLIPYIVKESEKKKNGASRKYMRRVRYLRPIHPIPFRSFVQSFSSYQRGKEQWQREKKRNREKRARRN